MTMKALTLSAALALAAITPAQAHGGFYFGLNIGLPWFGAPVYAYPPPPVWYYPPGAPTVVVPTPAIPDPVIRHVQAGLNALGFGPLNVDGIQGPATWNAIAAFQQVNGLAVDGIAGSGTLAVLDHQLGLDRQRPLQASPPPPPAKEPPPEPPKGSQ
jgi:hypothetical protein